MRFTSRSRPVRLPQRSEERSGAAAARHYARRFAVDDNADRLVNVLTEVLAGRSPAAAPTSGGTP
jgi:hypothetical protein